ncbi:MAG: peptide ABC transporter substrate-binding protein [Chloroflexota bacterium]|nr:peptide ABC transporter substrate-binding protein [Chloroflexota bacterium]
MFGSTYSPDEGTPGGEVVISDWQAADQLNLYYASGFKNTQVVASTMRGLYNISSDAKWTPDLAATVPTVGNGGVVIDDEAGTAECPLGEDAEAYAAYPEEVEPGFTVNIDMKPDLLWSDGETLDLNDMKYTFTDWMLDPDQTGLVGGTTGFDVIDTFDVADDGLSATVHFCRGYAGFYGLLASVILPEHYMSTLDVATAADTSYPVAPSTADAPVSGPFMYASLAPDTIELVRNDNYNSCVGENCTPHTAYLDRVIYKFYADKDAMIAGFLNSEIDVATDLLQGDFAAIEAAPEGFEATIDTAWEYEHFDMNQLGDAPGQGHPALTDENVRRAIAELIDKQALYETVYPGTPLPDEEPCVPTAPGLWYRADEADVTCIEYNPDEAVQLLDDAGWTDTDGDGIRDKNGEALTLLHCHTGAPFRQNAGDFLASAFRDAGIELKNTAEPTIFDGWNDVEATQTCNLAHGTYDTTEFAWVQSFDIFGSFYYTYHSSQIPTEENGGNGSNYVRLDDPRMDEALDRLFGATALSDQLELAHEVQAIHTELQPEVVLYYRSGVRGLNTSLRNFERNPGTASDMWNVEDWYLEQ